jgi:hypothetical protein
MLLDQDSVLIKYLSDDVCNVVVAHDDSYSSLSLELIEVDLGLHSLLSYDIGDVFDAFIELERLGDVLCEDLVDKELSVVVSGLWHLSSDTVEKVSKSLACFLEIGKINDLLQALSDLLILECAFNNLCVESYGKELIFNAVIHWLYE